MLAVDFKLETIIYKVMNQHLLKYVVVHRRKREHVYFQIIHGIVLPFTFSCNISLGFDGTQNN